MATNASYIQYSIKMSLYLMNKTVWLKKEIEDKITKSKWITYHSFSWFYRHFSAEMLKLQKYFDCSTLRMSELNLVLHVVQNAT